MMRRFAIAIFALLILVSTTFAQDHRERTPPPPGPTPPPIQPQTQPLRYNSPEGRYSIMFPSQPKLSTQNMTDASGQPYVQYMAMASDADTLLMVAYFDYGSGIVFSLDKARDGMVQALGGTLLDEQSISLGGAPGRQLKIAGTTQGIEFIDRVRFFDVNRRIYVLQCMAQRRADGPTSAERCEQFFDSFRTQTAR